MVPPALLVKKFDQVLFHVLLGQNETANEYAQNVLRPTFCGIFVFPTWHLWSHWTQFLVLQYPGSSVYRVPEVFLARGGNFRCWPKADTSSAVGRSHEPDGNRSKKSLWHLGGQGFESRTSLNFFWLSFATAKDCVKNAMIFFHIIQLTLFKVLKTFEANVSAARPWVRCLTHGAFH